MCQARWMGVSWRGRDWACLASIGLLLGQQACFWILGVGGAHGKPGTVLNMGKAGPEQTPAMPGGT